ncbi:MAG: hypothetical protein A2W00_04420 [Candidatus Eisenbacteria bacterium RBG_16_71_46]|nr:MAG: hypothetical protein A2W00_04420 [Candidatus Eisenbacteria bacterium RBG_16_71_46]
MLPDGAGGAFIAWWDQRSGSFDIYLQRVDFAGVPKWTANGIALADAPGDQWACNLTSDGAGGCIVAWNDTSLGLGNGRFYVQRVDANGVVRWTPGGVRVCPLESVQGRRAVLGDGAGGVFCVWGDQRGADSDLYAQHLDGDGAPLWSPDGVPICTAPGNQLLSMITMGLVPDGAGGFIVTWYDQRNGVGNDDIYAQRVDVFGTPLWAFDGVPLCTAWGAQVSPVVCSNGLGGAIVAWTDSRLGYSQIYAQQVDPYGIPLWPADGIVVGNPNVSQGGLRMVADGANGAILAWYDYRYGSSDVFAQRVSSSGIQQWGGDVPLCTNWADQAAIELASDGFGGAVATWRDERSGVSSGDVYAQRVNASGSLLWAFDGVAVSTAAGDVDVVRLCSDAYGGAILAFNEYRGGEEDLYAQRVSGDGSLGGREPRIASAGDIGPDQGGRVRVLWDRSDLDQSGSPGIESYSLWRRVITSAGALRATGPGTTWAEDPALPASGGRTLLRVPGARGEATYWEYIVTVPAWGQSGYGYTAATTADSMPGLLPWNVFLVTAKIAGGPTAYMSAPDSGYSVDNLAPGAPAPFTAAYASGATWLHWGQSAEPDVGEYRLYRGASADFVPGPGNLVVAQSDTGYADVGPAGGFYKLSAVDVHGNQSGFALIRPQDTTDVPAGEGPALLLGPVRPNPGRGDRLVVRFSLDRPGGSRLALLDVTGRQIVEREVGSLGPGRHEVDLARGQRLVPGIYFVRLVRGAEVRVRRAVVVD